jgi:hypothetical protein
MTLRPANLSHSGPAMRRGWSGPGAGPVNGLRESGDECQRSVLLYRSPNLTTIRILPRRLVNCGNFAIVDPLSARRVGKLPGFRRVPHHVPRPLASPLSGRFLKKPRKRSQRVPGYDVQTAIRLAPVRNRTPPVRSFVPPSSLTSAEFADLHSMSTFLRPKSRVPGHHSLAFPQRFYPFSIQSPPVSYVQSAAQFFKLFGFHGPLHPLITDLVLMRSMKRSMTSMRTRRHGTLGFRLMRGWNCLEEHIAIASEFRHRQPNEIPKTLRRREREKSPQPLRGCG